MDAIDTENDESRSRKASLSLTSNKDRHRARLTRPHELTVLVMVGLPARGKSFISKKLERFLKWRGEQVEIFNVGERRRKHDSAGNGKAHDAAFFGEQNRALREKIATDVLMEVVHWLRTGDEVASASSPTPPASTSTVDVTDASAAPLDFVPPPAAGEVPPSLRLSTSSSSRVSLSRSESEEYPAHSKRPTRTAIFDATNTTASRRKAVANTLARELPSCRVVFVESICDDESVLERNLSQKVSLSPDYQSKDLELALTDLRERIKQYEAVYETLCVPERLSFIKLFNLSSQLHLNMIYGSVAKSLVPYMMGIHIGRRPIWLVRAAHCDGTPPATPESARPSKTVVVKRSAALSTEGLKFAKRLGRFCAERCVEFAASNAEVYEEPTSQQPTPNMPSRMASLSGTNLHVLAMAELSGSESSSPQAPRPVPRSGSLCGESPAACGEGGGLGGSLGGVLGGSSALDLSLVASLDAAVADGRLAENTLNPAFQCSVFTSTLPRAMQTAQFVQTSDGAGQVQASSALNPIDRGTAYGLTEDQFASQHPEEFARQKNDVRHVRFPGGESYADLLQRVEPFLIELEQQTSPVLIVSHLSVLQALSSYFTGATLEEALATSIPHHAVLQLTPASQAMMWEQQLVPLMSPSHDYLDD